ncbi:GNAT family N-acetyltransferase [Gordonia liuliyuniae]|uniref:GNAT family N-acetyltransferase n=1 Tax=Gordonia liuliyuniae TaxID=2911517 RepID=A0ABS9IRH3_9ACTN|nr:GNAT family N-acetyltransferase [Gordonia liuliyuniae]MCF8588157.1 GNAT family N-acetyltransferase [Gordonia liuliyuniae]
MIREGRRSDVVVLQEIEIAAGALFAGLGMGLVANDDPLPIEYLTEVVDDGRCWVVVDETERPAAYLIVETVDETAHIEQVSVHPDYARRGLGAALIERAADWARKRRLPAVTLTTYVDVPWNGPYYVRSGFRYLADSEETPGLKAIRAQEKSHGLDLWPRACMLREV